MIRPAQWLGLSSWRTACFGAFVFGLAACGARSELDAGEPAVVPDGCGDGTVEAGEECDDGNDVDTDGCGNDCTVRTCGDGVVDPAEECDLGDGNEDRPAILLIDDALSTPVTPVRRSSAATAFYDYSSESSHTGFEALHASRLFLYQQTGAPGLSLFTFHGIDLDSTGQDEGDGAVQQTITGLPAGAFVALADEPNELAMQTEGTAFGDWSYHHNADGGVLGGVPFPGSWQIVIDSDFIASATSWQYVDGDGKPISLSLPTATLQAFDEPSACRTDCTIPRCGDGRLDAGEVCDDGNEAPADGCAGDCQSTN